MLVNAKIFAVKAKTSFYSYDPMTKRVPVMQCLTVYVTCSLGGSTYKNKKEIWNVIIEGLYIANILTLFHFSGPYKSLNFGVGWKPILYRLTSAADTELKCFKMLRWIGVNNNSPSNCQMRREGVSADKSHSRLFSEMCNFKHALPFVLPAIKHKIHCKNGV